MDWNVIAIGKALVFEDRRDGTSLYIVASVTKGQIYFEIHDSLASALADARITITIEVEQGMPVWEQATLDHVATWFDDEVNRGEEVGASVAYDLAA